MIIAGLNKLSLIDFPGKICTVIFTYGCNFRCGYCHNPELVVKELDHSGVVKEELMGFLKSRGNILDGVVITGGEPTLHEDLGEFICQIKRLGFAVKLDTNGSNSKVVKMFIKEKLVDYWAIDVKYNQLGYAKYEKQNGLWSNVMSSINAIRESGCDYEFRTTVVRGIHSPQMIEEIEKVVKGAKRHMIQNFKEAKTIDYSFSERNSFLQEELEEFKKIMEKYIEKVEIRN